MKMERTIDGTRFVITGISTTSRGVVAAADGVRADLMVARAIVDHGIASSDAFSFMRRALGVHGVALARVLGVRAETVSRWERGQARVPRSAWALLAVMVGQRTGRTPDVLGMLSDDAPRVRPPRRVDIKMPRAA